MHDYAIDSWECVFRDPERSVCRARPGCHEGGEPGVGHANMGAQVGGNGAQKR